MRELGGGGQGFKQSRWKPHDLASDLLKRKDRVGAFTGALNLGDGGDPHEQPQGTDPEACIDGPRCQGPSMANRGRFKMWLSRNPEAVLHFGVCEASDLVPSG